MRTIVLHDGLPKHFPLAMDKISSWGLPHYTNVEVYSDFGRTNDLIAVFKTEEGNTFTLGCIWDEDNWSYSYHS